MKKIFLLCLSAVMAVFVMSAQSVPTLYGVLKSLPSDTQYPSGIYSIPAESPVMATKVMETDMKATKCTAWVGNKLYGYKVTSSYPYSVSYFVIDTESWTVEKTTTISSNTTDAPSSMYYNPSDGKVYGYLNMTNSIYEINLETGKMTLVKVMTDANLAFNSMAANSSGSVYATDASGNLWLVYPTEGRASKVGSTELASSNLLPTVVDLRSGDMYMIYAPAYGSSRQLYKINTSNAETTLIGSLLNNMTFAGVFIKNEAQAEDALRPSSSTAIGATFTTVGGKEAVLEAVAPEVAYDLKTSLTGKVDMKFYVDDVEAGTATGIAPGQKATVSHTFTAEGLHYIKVVASNSAGNGPEAMNRIYVGFDTPKPVSDLTLAIATGGKVTLTWAAPAGGVNNGGVDPATLAYTIVRMPEGKTVAEGLKATTFTETLPDSYLRDYFYIVTATSKGGNSEGASSNHVASGNAVRLPFVDDFQNDYQWNLYTIIDENEDENSWTYNATQATAELRGNKNAATDWLLMPVVNMRKGVTYTLKISAKTAFNQSGNIEVYMLDEPEVPFGGTDALKWVGATVLSDVLTETTYSYECQSDAPQYFGIYNYSNPNVRVEIHSVAITATSAPDAPAKVSDMMVVAGEKGAMYATILFKAPTTLENGETLTAANFKAIEIYAGNNDKAIYRIENPKPGQAYSYKDESAFHGMNYYRVICFNDNGNGGTANGSAWVGEDYAKAPQNFKATYDPTTDEVSLKWDAPSAEGYSKGWVDLDNIKYSVAVFVLGGATEDYITFAENLTTRSAKISVSDFRFLFGPGDRQGVSFKVTPNTAAGAGVPAVSTVVIGDAYTLPFAESFANSSTSTKPWSVMNDPGSPVAWAMRRSAPEAASLAGLEPQDGDGGMALFYATSKASSKLVGPKISIDGAEDPMVTFYLYHRTAKGDNWCQFGALDDNGEYHALSEKISIDGFGWQKHEIHIKEFNTDNLDQFRFVFYGSAEADVDFYLDNIVISDGEALSPYPTVKNLKASFDGVNVNLTWDAPDSNNYSLIGYYVYRDGVKITDRYLTETKYADKLTPDGADHTYSVSVVYNEGDSDPCAPVKFSFSSLDNVGADNCVVAVVDGKIVISGATPYAVYTLSGVCVAEGVVTDVVAIELPAGMYLVKTVAKTTKAIL